VKYRLTKVHVAALVAFCAGVSVSFFTLPLWVVPLIESAKGSAPIGSQIYAFLKDFQTLLAALIALAGGALAYSGAMAKVSLDREIDERHENADRIQLYLRLRFALVNISAEMASICRSIPDPPEGGLYIRWKDPSELRVSVPELDDAWQKFHLLPQGAIEYVPVLRSLIRQIEQTVAAMGDPNTMPPRPIGYVGVALVRQYHQHCEIAIDASGHLVRILDVAIDPLLGIPS